jgi:hypothetical protein
MTMSRPHSHSWSIIILNLLIISSFEINLAISLSLIGCTALVDLGRFFSFLILYTAGRTPWVGDQPVARPLPTCRTTQTQNKRTQTSMPRVGFEPTTPVFDRAKMVHVLDRAATMIGTWRFRRLKIHYPADWGSVFWHSSSAPVLTPDAIWFWRTVTCISQSLAVNACNKLQVSHLELRLLSLHYHNVCRIVTYLTCWTSWSAHAGFLHTIKIYNFVISLF